MTNVDMPMFSVNQVSAATGVAKMVLEGWFFRGYVRGDVSDQGGGGKGIRRRLTLRSVLRIAAMAEMVKLGLPLKDAGRIARALYVENSGGIVQIHPDGSTAAGKRAAAVVLNLDLIEERVRSSLLSAAMLAA